MARPTRFAVYWAPEAGSPLARFGAAWLGRDAETGETVAQPVLPGVTPLSEITTRPRHYGFHATLKPPFRLAEGATPEGLTAAIERMSEGLAPVTAPALAPAVMRGFLCLRPGAPAPALERLAAACVTGLDAFRAPAPEAELARRRATGLTPGQAATLARWGYPYLMAEAAFHLTLTDPIGPERAHAVARDYAPVLAEAGAARLRVEEICLFEERDGAPLRLVRRFPLRGRRAQDAARREPVKERPADSG